MTFDQFELTMLSKEELKMLVVRLQGEIVRKNTEIARLQGELADTKANLLIQDDLRTRLALAEERLQHTKRTWKSKLLAVFVGVLNIGAIFLFNYGNSLITATHPDQNGYYMLAIAGVTTFITTCTTIFILAGSPL